MPDDDSIDIPGLGDNGKVLLLIRRHWASLLPSIATFLVMILLPWLLLFVFGTFQTDFFAQSTTVVILLLSAFYLILSGVAFILWASFYCDFYIITERTVICVTQEGVFDRQITEISLLRVQEGNSEIKGFLGTVFGFGDVVIQTASEKEKAILSDVPDPYRVNQKILDFHEALIKKEEMAFALGVGEGEASAKHVEPVVKNEAISKEVNELKEDEVIEL